MTAEEHSIIGGLGEAVAGYVAARCPRPVYRVGMQDVFGESGMAGELLDKFGLRAVNIAAQLTRMADSDCGSRKLPSE